MSETQKALWSRFLKKADPEAFSEIVRQNAGLVYGVCLRILQDEDKAADAVQETFFQLLRSGGQITGSISGWLHRVAASKAVDRIRRDSLRKEHEKQYSFQPPIQVESWQQLSPFVDEELNKLDEQTREVLILHFFAGKTTRVISREMGISQSTVSRRIEAGLDQLRRRLTSRGLLITSAALGGLFVQNAVQAAPAALAAELGKMALVAGTGAAGVSGTAAASTGKTAAEGILACIKAKAVAAAAVAAVGVGTVVTYHHMSQPRSEETPAVQSVQERSTPRPRGPYRTGLTVPSGSNILYIERDTETLAVPEPEEREQEPSDDFDAWLESLFAQDTPEEDSSGQSAQAAVPTDGTGGGMMGGGAIGNDELGGGFVGGMMGGLAIPDENPEVVEESQ